MNGWQLRRPEVPVRLLTPPEGMHGAVEVVLRSPDWSSDAGWERMMVQSNRADRLWARKLREAL